jgi:hypothetical protein
MPRDRVTLDLRGIGPALRAHAEARNTPVASVVRKLVVAQLALLEPPSERRAPREAAQMPSKKSVKLTVRLPSHVAEQVTRGAQASGGSYGEYLTTLIEGAPASPSFSDRREALTKLGSSTDRLAAVFVDLKHLGRLMNGSGDTATHLALDGLAPIVAELREHLALASRVVSELKPGAMRRAQASGTAHSRRA